MRSILWYNISRYVPTYRKDINMKTLTKLKIPAVVLLTSGMVATALSVPTHVRAESQPVSQVASLAEKIKEERSAIGKTDYLPDILGRIGYAVMVAEQQQLANIRNYQKPDVSYYYEGDVIESVGKLAKNTDVRTSNIFDLPSTDIPFDSDSVVENPFADIEETTKSDANTSIKPPTVKDEPKLPTVKDEPKLPTVKDEPKLPTVKDEPKLPTVTDEPVLPPVTDEPVLPPVTDEPVLPPVTDGPVLPPVTDEPVLPPVTDEPVLPPVTDEPVLPPVTDEPVFPPVTDEPMLPPMIDDIDTPLAPPIEPPLDWNAPPTPPIGWDDIPEAPKPVNPDTPIVKPIASGDGTRKTDDSDVRFRQVVEDIPQGRTVQYDDTLPAGQSKLIPGTKGQMIKSYKDTYQNGVLSYSSLVETKTTVEPINDILVMGSKVATSAQIIDLNTGDSIHGAIIKSIHHDARAFMGKSYHDLMTESEDDRFNNAVATIDLSYLVEDVDGEDMWAWAGVGNDVVSEFNGNKLINSEKVNAYFVEYINMDRKAHGIKPIKYDSILAKLSEVRAQEMADYGHIRYQGKAHTRPDGSSWATIMDGLPSDYTSNGFGENMLAYSILSNPYQLVSEQWIAKRLFEQWKASPSHYKAMMNPNYTRTGVSVKLTTRDKAQNDNGTNWMIGAELFS